MNKLKIVQVIDILEQGGAQQLLYDLLKNLNNDFEFLILAFEGGPVADKIKKLGVNVKILGINPSKIGFRYLLNLNKTLCWLKENYISFKPDIIQTHLLGADIWARLVSSKKVKLIQTVHSAEDFRGRVFSKKGFKTWFFDHLFLNKTNIIIVVSLAVKTALIRQGVKNKIVVIPTGIDLTKFKASDAIRQRTRERMGWKDKIIIGSVGRLDPVKGYDQLIENLKNLFIQNKKLHLVLVGNGPQKLYLENLINKLNLKNEIELLGERQDIPQLLNGFDIFVSSSVWEGMPIAVLEAMASGLPVLSTYNGGIKNIIVDRETGLLYSFGKDLEKKIMLLVNDSNLVQKLGQNARHKVKEFDIINVAKKYRKIYNSI